MPAEPIRRAKKPRVVKSKKKAPAVDISEEQLPLFINQLPRAKLEELLKKLYSDSVDCSFIIREETAHGLLATGAPVLDVAEEQVVPRNLGQLGVLPNEVITEILRYLGIKDLLIITGRVCKSLVPFRWLRPLWESVDTREVTYAVLNDLCPSIDKYVPGVIKHIVVSFKCQMLPKAEKFLVYCAKQHNLESLVLWQSDGTITQRRLENIKKLVSECESFQNIKRFKIHIPNDYCGRDYPILCAETCIDLVSYWPKLESFSIEMPRGWSKLSEGYMRRLSHAGSEVKGIPLTTAMNYITHLSLDHGIRFDTEVIFQAGSWFPELESLKLTEIDSFEGLMHRVKTSSDYDKGLISSLPRLRTLHIGYAEAKERHTHTLSVLFFAILKQAPMLTDYTYINREHFDKIKLFNAVKRWVPFWRPIHHKDLKHLRVRDWAIEWQLLSFKSPCKFPRLVKMNMENCTTIDVTDPTILMKCGGRHR